MNRLKITNTLLAITLLFVAFSSAFANEVEILATDFYKTGKNLWTINVTLRHEDTGWEHYADNWRVVDSKSNILGDRVLYHPHVNEQPFTRSLNNVMIPEDGTIVYIVAHDNVHGWSPDRLKVDLNLSVSGRLRIEENKN